MTYYAKPDQTYEEHIDAVYRAWKQTVTAKAALIDRLASKYGFDKDRFLAGSLLSVAFHDIGKMNNVFQKMMEAKRLGNAVNTRKNYRHELISFVYAVNCWSVLNMEKCLSIAPLEALAIAGHHKYLDVDMTAFERECTSDAPYILSDGIDHAIEIAKKIFSREGLLLKLPLNLRALSGNPYISLSGFLYKALNKCVQHDGPEKTRALYSLFKGILHYADWHGSGKSDVVYSVEKEPQVLISELRQRCLDKNIPFNGLTPFQQACSEHSGHLIGVAPTGSGKTEASILWALKNAKEMGGGKILYLLPTMVTANSIWKRLRGFFGTENVGLTHSTASLFSQAEQDAGEEDEWENRRGMLFSQTFIEPVTVATVDQLLTSGFNSGRWTLKEVNAANSVIILDEIHAYEGWTLGLIVATVKHFSAQGARFMLMSATMPKSLNYLFAGVLQLQASACIKDEVLLNASRSTYVVMDVEISDADAIDEIKSALSAGKKVLVVVNDVKSCQQLAERKELSDYYPTCYHSQFILKDRKNIESRLDEARFVIATQVVEVALDIDFDYLFTECAPPDAIAQRAGRVNRYRDDNRDSRVYICKYSDKSKKIYCDIADPDLLARSYEAFKSMPARVTESDLVSVIDSVYEGKALDELDSYKEAVACYHKIQERRMMILDSRLADEKQEVTRQSNYEKESVIPYSFKDEVMALKPAERRWYEIKLPLWFVRKNKHFERGIQGDILFCDVEYDDILGAVIKDDSGHESSMIF